MHGYIRVKMDGRLGGKRTGWEIRLSMPSKREADKVRTLLKKVPLRAGKTFEKHKRFVIPLYGRRQVEIFLQRVKPDRKSAIPRRFQD